MWHLFDNVTGDDNDLMLMVRHTSAGEKYSKQSTKRRISSVSSARSQLVILFIHECLMCKIASISCADCTVSTTLFGLCLN